MAVETGTVLEKMQRELTAACDKQDQEASITKHIEKIQLLCELLQDDEVSCGPADTSASLSRMTSAEMKAMLGDRPYEKHADKHDHDGANGDSIFDF